METFRLKLNKTDVEALQRLARHRSFLKNCDCTWQTLVRESVAKLLAAEGVTRS